ncbi:MAG: UDP-N-acetylmuramoyl-L-alanine--D-glutamate ligase [Melioribacteraceae bacterium]|nr:UDP-N-acetylmuramoyl-L-alanine--D-glutamate ligase [Melioribacteraceae bacterium]MCF8354522.1 UDP-N-acetylmuramoyl-L-alanine--D-glutamate ligase [Melioribacteraceae bacterium]MCF8394291.1 UDP-N-acetylmuramoyl-L-alanine--D-glutamate ligase [Melioribacteraceae bacterium]MCF8418191.1 UDP-N-acetylmuramoyl-L-alanine--D-glutamate ligase [Melioribacteraceae bacterium]
MNYKGLKISIIGAVRSGVAAAKLAKRLGAVPFVSDTAEEEKIAQNLVMLNSEGIAFESGGHSGKVFDCDLLVTSPGVPSDSEVLTKAKSLGIKIISELEFASSVCKGNVIAVTGTNGKTTTTALFAHVINNCGGKAYTAGNIGRAFSEIALNVSEDEYVSLEVSSFQLDFIERFKPKFATILNITPDHLDRYGNDINNYINSKKRISENQDEKDFYISNDDDELTRIIYSNATQYAFSIKNKVSNGAYSHDGKIFFVSDNKFDHVCDTSDLSIKGEHNLYNALPVVITAKIIGFENDLIKKGLSTFPGVEHRLEFVREIDGVKYINDSKATNVDSVWYALRSFEDPIILILGGKDKGNDYNQIKELVKNRVKKIYAIGSSSKKVFDFFSEFVDTEIVDTLENCVKRSLGDREEGDIVLLSPACASFDMFENYEHRGRVFKEAVNNL